MRIGLLSPYNGTNLGDQCIIDSMMAALRRLAAPQRVEFACICLNPGQVGALHHVATFPVTGLAVHFYSTAAGLFHAPTSHQTASTDRIHTVAAQLGLHPRLKTLVKSAPGARWFASVLRNWQDQVIRLPREVLWLIRSRRLIARLDAIVICGGGQIDEEWGGPWGHPYSLFRWSILARWRGIPLVVASVGVCKIDSRLSQWFCRAALRSASLVSCRDLNSVTQASDLTGRKNICWVPDIAYSTDLAPTDGETHPELSYVLVSPIAFGLPGAWPTEDESTYRRYISTLAQCVCDLHARGLTVRMTLTSSPDNPAVRDLQAAIRELNPGAHSAALLVRPRTIEKLAELIRGCSFMIASRLHGIMISHILERPVIAISFDRKVDAQMSMATQSDFCMDIRSVTSDRLRNLVDKIQASAPAIRMILREQRQANRALLELQSGEIIRLASGSAPVKT